MPTPDLELMRTAWRAVARYTVYRSEGLGSKSRPVKKPLHVNQTWDEAQKNVAEAEVHLRLEPGYRPDVMCRPVIGIELEQPEETRIAYRTAFN